MSDGSELDPSSSTAAYDLGDEAESTLEAMIEAGETLPRALKERVVSLGSEATEPLIDILTDEALSHGQARGEGWAPAHAAAVLAERGDLEAIEPMVELLRNCKPGEVLQPELIEALQAFGDDAFSPVLEVLESTADHEVRSSMLDVASSLEVEDDSLYRELVDFFRDDPEIGAGYLANYGDDRALDILYEALDGIEVDTSGAMLANQDIVEIGEAIRDLGGQPPERLLDKIRLVKRRRRRGGSGLERLIEDFGGEDDETEPAETDRDIGRNEPCWCGSGQKYKHCHWRDDRRQGRRKKKKK